MLFKIFFFDKMLRMLTKKQNGFIFVWLIPGLQCLINNMLSFIQELIFIYLFCGL